MTSKQSNIPSAGTVYLSPETTPGFVHVDGLTQDSADKASELLTLNHELYHTRWNGIFHNHMSHHLLALWAMGATPDEIQVGWENNKIYQVPLDQFDKAADSPGQQDLKDPVLFEKALGNYSHYVNFLQLFKSELAEKGTPAVIKEYVLKGDARANDILGRMFSDLMHPIIHLGCGIEFQQPALIAEALAQACIHGSWPSTFLLPTEDHVRSNPDTPSKSLLQIINSMRDDPLINYPVSNPASRNKIPDDFLKRVTPGHLVPYLSHYQVKPEPADLQRKLHEMMLTTAYVVGAAQQPGKHEALDFVTLHSATTAVFFPAILAQDWLSDHDKARLLEAKARVDAVSYGGCGAPALYPARIADYKPRHPEDGWPELIRRGVVFADEGHTLKMLRALFGLEQLVGDELAGFDVPIVKEDIIKIAHMEMDSIERAKEPGGHTMPAFVEERMLEGVRPEGVETVKGLVQRWVLYSGLERAWDWVPDLKTAAA
ncbi:hypothetical protein B0T17DRAFT_500544 [Bombardia bombarda]|uniref:Oxidoreductase AflY n=1 Tax=Bombardia bombarda TaxID=252184 RepID=A0AA39TRS7_9PEZI|nr:hypothetical protein B0T17DRAFT_500544 [Bombardia bombarda]